MPARTAPPGPTRARPRPPRPAARHPLRVLGLMSGTSLDGVDCALCEVRPDRVVLERLWSAGFAPALRRRLHAAARGEATSHDTGQLHHDLGRAYAAVALKGLGRARVDLVGLHGQTVFHHPHPGRPATLQLGEPAYLAEALRVPVVSNFRAGDVAAGGQGAPLATLFHKVVFAAPGHFVCVHNLGGISNVTALDWRQRGPEPRTLAFDTGPANVLLDLAARTLSHGRRTCDRAGAWARQGRACMPLVERWLRHPFFRQPPPKSTGREQFGEPFWSRVQGAFARHRLGRCDILATLTEFTARSIALNYSLHLGGVPGRVIVAGGGAKNPALLARLAACLREFAPRLRIVTSATLGWPTQAIEPAAFALLAAYRVWGLPGNLPATTGARHPAVLGQVTAPYGGS